MSSTTHHMDVAAIVESAVDLNGFYEVQSVEGQDMLFVDSGKLNELGIKYASKVGTNTSLDNNFFIESFTLTMILNGKMNFGDLYDSEIGYPYIEASPRMNEAIIFLDAAYNFVAYILL